MLRSLPGTLVLLSSLLSVAWSHDPSGDVPQKTSPSNDREVIELPLPPNLDANEEKSNSPPTGAEQLPTGDKGVGENPPPQPLPQFQRRSPSSKPNPGLFDDEGAPLRGSNQLPAVEDPFEERFQHRHGSPSRPATRREVPQCPVSGHRLDRFGAPYSVSFQGETVYACCRACASVIQQFPEDYFAMPNEPEFDWNVPQPSEWPCRHHCHHHFYGE